MALFDSHRVFRNFALACLVAVSGTAVPVMAASTGATAPESAEVEAKAGPRTALKIEGISVQGDDDYPRVLNILPWQPPTVSRRARDPLRLDDAGLLQPVDPDAMRRHSQFRQTLDPLGTSSRTR